MKKHVTTAVALALLLACASPAKGPPLQPVQLDNGTVVQLVGLGSVALPGGEVGLLIDYVTSHPLNSSAVAAEVPFVWWEFLPELKRRGFAQGLVRAMPHAPTPGRNDGRMWRGCLTDSGETLWLHLDGGLTPSDRAASKRCAPPTATFQGEPTLRITPSQ